MPALTYSALAAELPARKIYGVFREADPVRTYPGETVGSVGGRLLGADGRAWAGWSQRSTRTWPASKARRPSRARRMAAGSRWGSPLTPARNGMTTS